MLAVISQDCLGRYTPLTANVNRVNCELQTSSNCAFSVEDRDSAQEGEM